MRNSFPPAVFLHSLTSSFESLDGSKFFSCSTYVKLNSNGDFTIYNCKVLIYKEFEHGTYITYENVRNIQSATFVGICNRWKHVSDYFIKIWICIKIDSPAIECVGQIFFFIVYIKVIITNLLYEWIYRSRMSARQCLEHPWMAQHAEAMSRIALPTEKLKKFIVRRKWQVRINLVLVDLQIFCIVCCCNVLQFLQLFELV